MPILPTATSSSEVQSLPVVEPDTDASFQKREAILPSMDVQTPQSSLNQNVASANPSPKGVISANSQHSFGRGRGRGCGRGVMKFQGKLSQLSSDVSE